MPLKRRKLTARAAAMSVVMAPFALILINLIAGWWVLVVAAASLFACWIFGVADLSGGFPDKKDLVTCGMTLVGIAIIAIPLAIRDYVFGHGDGWQWIPDEECRKAGVRYAELILRNDVDALWPHLLPWLAASVDRSDMSAACARVANAETRPVSVRSAVEVSPQEGEPEDFDAIVQVVVDGIHQPACGMLEFYIDAAGGQRIVSWEYWRYTEGDPQRAALVVQVAPRLDAAAV